MIYTSAQVLAVLIMVTTNAFEDSLSDFSKPYYCSTCFTNAQHQNYHCCFYFFKCCAEARRGSKATTPSPQYPGLPRSEDSDGRRRTTSATTLCARDCKEAHPAACCEEDQAFKIPGASSNVSRYGQPVRMHTVNVSHAGYSMHLRTLNVSDLSYQEVNDTAEDDSDVHGLGIPSKEDPRGGGSASYLGIDSYPSSTGLGSSKNLDFADKIFLPPPIALRYMSRHQESKSKSAAAGEKTLGWFTRELLDDSDKYSKDTRPVSVSDESTIIWGGAK